MAEPEILNVPPSEAVDHFKAKAMRLDILEAVRGEVDRAIADGIAFGEFHESLEPRLRSLGWWGRQPMVDPETGEVRVVQLGSPHRLNTIFDTNLRTSYAAGRWERIQRVKESSPWLRYVAVQDSRTRPEHMAWHGTVLPVDHPFWRTHYPPNGWKCRCTVEQTVTHHDLAPADYALVQRILDEGELFTERKRHAAGFLQVDGKIWSAVVKSTGDGSRTYLASFHRAQPRDLEKAHFRLDRVQR